MFEVRHLHKFYKIFLYSRFLYNNFIHTYGNNTFCIKMLRSQVNFSETFSFSAKLHTFGNCIINYLKIIARNKLNKINKSNRRIYLNEN